MRYLAGCLLICLSPACSAQQKAIGKAGPEPKRGTHGAVAAGTDAAADAGMELFRKGGNAVDAGVATMFAASVAEFTHFGFGGEAPILIRTKDGKVVCLAGVGTMPKAASAQLFRTRRLKFGEVLMMERNGLEGMIPVAGIMPALVPGMVEAGLVALREYGNRSFEEVIAPAIRLADGMPLDETRARYLPRLRRFFDLWPTSKAVFLPDGQAAKVGETFRQPALAKTLRTMVEAEKRVLAKGGSRQAAIDAVRDVFYRGEIARKIDEFSRANGGLLRYEDMAAFRLQPEPAVSTTYHGYTVFKPGFWSQGPSMIQALNILEGFDIAGMGLNSTTYVHTMTEALKLAYADRDTYYGDPKFVSVPDRLLSKEYAAERRKQISEKASMEFRPGRAGDHPRRHPSQEDHVRTHIDDALMTGDTTCVNAIDKDGMIFSATPSGASLPSVIAGDTGVALSHRAQSFFLIEGHPNELAGGKRPRVTLSPTIVLQKNKPFLALSTPGGDNQDQALIQLLFNVVEFDMNPEEAVEAPRLQTRHLVSSFDNHAMNPGELLLDERIEPSVFRALAARGHIIEKNSRWSSGAAPVMIRMNPNGVIEAGADPYGDRTARAW